ncbi:MAG TPA: SDR family NAD(P)-dependent oxidoreductase, partial [Burkholderiaceae bacterium]|nr:SDR family NAD(P)-dependent oxidoreductase [Burkholderiaceae bacterium]
MRSALVVGAGPGISLAFARVLAAHDYTVTLASRTPGAELIAEAGRIGARIATADATDAAQVERLFAELDAGGDALDVVLYNASYRVRGPLVGLDPAQVARSLNVTAFGGFLVAQQAARRMLARGSGTMLFTGASASVKGYPESAPFAMGKFALRGLAQSMARELAPRGIHVAHVVIDG